MKRVCIVLLAYITAHNLFCVDQGEQYHIYIWARYNQAQENHSIAQVCYNILIKNSPSLYIYPSFIEYLFDLQQYTIIVQLVSALKNSITFDLQTKLLLAQSFHQAGLIDQAGVYLGELAHDYPANPEVMYAAAQFHILANNPTQALQLIDIYLNHASSGQHVPIFQFMKAQIFMLQKKYAAARSILETTLTANATFDKAWLLFGLVNELDGNAEKAIHAYQQYLKLSGSNQLVEEQLARLQKMHSISNKP